MPVQTDDSYIPKISKRYKPLRHRSADMAARLFARGVRRRNLARRIAYPFIPHDEAAALWRYRWYHGVEANLETPKGLDEKICWLQIHDRRPWLSRLACKIEVGDLVREAGYGHLLKELFGFWDRPEDIDFDALPNHFALKSAHGTAQNYFHETDQPPDRVALREVAQEWLETDHASHFGEWAYRGIKPRILAEELLVRPTQDGLPELRVWCFDGEPRFIRYNFSVGGPPGHANSTGSANLELDTDWNRLPFRSSVSLWANMPDRPDYLDEMLAAARALSRDMALLRVDFTDCGGHLYFSELTIYPQAAGHSWDPPDTDLMLGKMLTLPDPESLRGR